MYYNYIVFSRFVRFFYMSFKDWVELERRFSWAVYDDVGSIEVSNFIKIDYPKNHKEILDLGVRYLGDIEVHFLPFYVSSKKYSPLISIILDANGNFVNCRSSGALEKHERKAVADFAASITNLDDFVIESILNLKNKYDKNYLPKNIIYRATAGMPKERISNAYSAFFEIISRSEHMVKRNGPYNYFLNGSKSVDRVDLSSKPTHMRAALNPKLFTLGAWTGEKPLYASQRIIANTFNGGILENKLLSVEASSSSGRLAVVKDYIANLFIERADAIYRAKNSSTRLFEPMGVVNVDGDEICYYQPIPPLRDKGVLVVASDRDVDRVVKDLNNDGRNELALDDADKHIFQIMENLRMAFDYKDLLSADGMLNQIEYGIPTKNTPRFEAFNSFKKEISNLFDFLGDERRSGKETPMDISNEEWESMDFNRIHKLTPYDDQNIADRKATLFQHSMIIIQNTIFENKDVFVDVVKLLDAIFTNKIEDKKVINATWDMLFVFVGAIVLKADETPYMLARMIEEQLNTSFIMDGHDIMPQRALPTLWASKQVCIFGQTSSTSYKYNSAISSDSYSYASAKNSFGVSLDVFGKSKWGGILMPHSFDQHHEIIDFRIDNFDEYVISTKTNTSGEGVSFMNTGTDDMMINMILDNKIDEILNNDITVIFDNELDLINFLKKHKDKVLNHFNVEDNIDVAYHAANQWYKRKLSLVGRGYSGSTDDAILIHKHNNSHSNHVVYDTAAAVFKNTIKSITIIGDKNSFIRSLNVDSF